MKKTSVFKISSGLTNDQRKALELFKTWLENNYSGNPYILSGYAGSGKTYLSMKLLRLVEEKDLCWTVAAPTHKAVGVLRQSLAFEKLRPTWYPSTIHRLLRLKLKRKGDLEVCERTNQTQSSLEQLGLVLIDEASMIDSNLLEIIFECAQAFGTRIVFVGDPAQLPPVGEEESSVFTINRALKAQLNEVIRHQGPVLDLANHFREGSLPSSAPPCMPILRTEKGAVGFLGHQEWLEQAKESLRQSMENSNPDGARILCYTNRNLESLVPHARRAIHGEMADQLPVLPGEVLISRQAVMAAASVNGVAVGEEPDMVIGSNREMIVKDVTPERFNLMEVGLAQIDELDVPIIETLIANVICGEMQLSLRLIPPADSVSRKILNSTLQKIKNQAKEADKQNSRALWRLFFLVRDSFASLGPASVLTVHRSQGSTFEEVYVASDVFWPGNTLLRKQLVYVAVSRASKGVWILGNEKIHTSNKGWEEFLKNRGN